MNAKTLYLAVLAATAVAVALVQPVNAQCVLSNRIDYTCGVYADCIYVATGLPCCEQFVAVNCDCSGENCFAGAGYQSGCGSYVECWVTDSSGAEQCRKIDYCCCV